MVPLDVDTICTSVKKTGAASSRTKQRASAVIGAELSATVQEECFWSLLAPIKRVTGWDTPYPHVFEWDYFPGQARMIAALKRGDGGASA